MSDRPADALLRDGLRLHAGGAIPPLDLPDHTGRARRLSELAGGDPVALLFSRGWWCLKEQRHLREVTACSTSPRSPTRAIVVVSVDPPEVQSAFRAGLGARFAFLSDAERRWRRVLGSSRRPTPCTGPTGRPRSRSSPT